MEKKEADTEKVGQSEEDRRIGKFSLGLAFIMEHRGLVRQLMGKMIIYRADLSEKGPMIDYWGVCDMFEEIPPGLIAPEYDINVTEKKGSGERWFTAKRRSDIVIP